MTRRAGGALAPLLLTAMVALTTRAPATAATATAAVTATAGIHSITPQRLVDTRTGLGVAIPGPLTAGVPLAIAFTGDAATAAGVAVNVTVTEPASAGYATVYPCGGPPPLASNVNFGVGQTVPNSAIVALGTDATVCVVTNVAAHLVVDLEGWFPIGSYDPSTAPTRVLDTRTDPSLRLKPGAETPVVQGVTGEAVVANVTATQARAGGYLVVYPCGTRPPLASNLNFVAGESVANLTIARPGVDGNVCARSSVATDVVVDVQGVIPVGAGYTSISPVRMVDTRSPVGVPSIARTKPGQVLELSFPVHSGIPTIVDAVAVNVTATAALGSGYITVFPCGEMVPVASNVNITPGETRPNLVLSKVSAAGTVCLTTNVAAHIVVDLQGWFDEGATAPPPSAPERQHVDVGVDLAAGYLAYLPAGYATSPGRTWPTIVFLHGSGQTGPGSGAALDGLEFNGLPRLYGAGTEPPVAAGFIVLAPQMPDGTNSAARLHLWLAQVLPRYHVDLDRVYLTGLSAGGYYSFDYVGALGDSNEFAAVVPVSGGFPHPIQCVNWQHTPLWAFHGEADTTVNPAGAIATVQTVNSKCSPVEPLRLTTFPGIAHEAWIPTYELSGMDPGSTNPDRDPYDIDVYSWMLSHVRSEYR